MMSGNGDNDDDDNGQNRDGNPIATHIVALVNPGKYDNFDFRRNFNIFYISGSHVTFYFYK